MPSFLNYWNTLADELGEWLTFPSTALSADAVTVTGSSLIDSSVGSDRYAHYHLYALDGALAGQQRLVTRGGFTTTSGALTVSRAFSANPASGVNWALVDKRFGVIRQDKKPGMRDFINRALREMAVDDVITITATTDYVRYLLPTSTNWWINEPGRIKGIQSTPANATERVIYRDYIDRIYFDGEQPVLQLKSALYRTGETFDLAVRRPANSWLKQSGTWTAQTSPTAGLTLDADEALPPITDVVTVALCHAYGAMLEEPNLGETRAYWEGRMQRQEAAAGLIKFAQAKPTEPYRLQISGGYDIGAFR